MKNLYYIRYNKMYLYELDLDLDYIDNDFISDVEFKMYKSNCMLFEKEKAELTILKLIDVGFDPLKFSCELKVEEL